ncbi:hypothetical protein [Legionella saoudiensis]|uniref:hypothetical protein n=1 Tax=Legionella saoudiensis TaxID=1750561 RepID=UPI0007304C7F|nr:hypothetical protein [Legionella saoudiensis]
MIKTIEQVTAFLKKATSWYEQRNTEQAVKMLYSRQKYLAGFFNGFNTFLDHFAKYGAVITLALSITSFLGLSMTPAGWVMVGSAMLIGGVVLAGNGIYSYLNKSKQLMEAIETRDAHESQIQELAKEIELQYAQHDVLEKELKILQESAKNLNLSPDLEIASTPPVKVNIKPTEGVKNIEKENPFVQGLRKLVAYAAVPFIALGQQFMKLVPLFKLSTELANATSPIQKRLREFAALLTFVTTSFTGLFAWASSLLGGGITQLSFLQTLSALAASLTPIGLQMICATILLISASLLLNKVFFQDPFDQLTKELEEKRAVHIDSLNQNQLLLSQIEYKNESLKEKVKLLTLQIDLKLQNTKNEEYNKKPTVEADEQIEHAPDSNDASKIDLKQKLIGNIQHLQLALQKYQEQLSKLEQEEMLGASDKNTSSKEELKLQELPIPASLPDATTEFNVRKIVESEKSPLRKFSIFKDNIALSDEDKTLTPKNRAP